MMSVATAAAAHRVGPQTPTTSASPPNLMVGNNKAWTPSPKRRLSRQGLCSTQYQSAMHCNLQQEVTLTPIRRGPIVNAESSRGTESTHYDVDHKCIIDKGEDKILLLKDIEKASESSRILQNDVNTNRIVQECVKSGAISISPISKNVAQQKNFENDKLSEISIIKPSCSMRNKAVDQKAGGEGGLSSPRMPSNHSDLTKVQLAQVKSPVLKIPFSKNQTAFAVLPPSTRNQTIKESTQISILLPESPNTNKEITETVSILKSQQDFIQTPISTKSFYRKSPECQSTSESLTARITNAVEMLKNSEKRSIDIGAVSPEANRKKQKSGEILSSTCKVEVVANPVLPNFADICVTYDNFELTDIPEEMCNPWCPENMEATSLHDVIQSNDVTSPDEVFMISDDMEEPYHLTGFPNPPGENRCWLNATLQALFALPLLESFHRFNLHESSKLTKYLVATRVHWMKGAVGKSKAYQTVKSLKEELGILDETYPSERQQDVSEFLMILLNHLKSDFDKLISLEEQQQEAENIPKNQQDSPRRRKMVTPNKRQPLADISFPHNSHNLSPKLRKQSLTHSVQDLLSPKVRRFSSTLDPSYKVHTPPLVPSNDNSVTYKNPIEENFELYLMEHYTCKGCQKNRQKKVDNLMLYVDLDTPVSNDSDTPISVDLQKAVEKILAPEERNLTCGSCKHDTHTMRTTFRRRPNILTLQLNRYGMTTDGIFAKISTPVSIPESLDLSTMLMDGDDTPSEDTNTYEPICIIAHAGGTMDCGHYTSYVRHDHQWFHYNDMHVAPITREEALSAAQTTAYLVFFVKSTSSEQASD